MFRNYKPHCTCVHLVGLMKNAWSDNGRRKKGRLSPNSATVAVVAVFGDSRRFWRQFVVEIGDSVDTGQASLPHCHRKRRLSPSFRRQIVADSRQCATRTSILNCSSCDRDAQNTYNYNSDTDADASDNNEILCQLQVDSVWTRLRYTQNTIEYYVSLISTTTTIQQQRQRQQQQQVKKIAKHYINLCKLLAE